MAIFQVADIAAARAHLAGLGLRTVFAADLDDVACTHVHPAEVGAAIVSVDQATPPGSWRWAGPAWRDEVRTGVATGLAGIRLTGPDPGACSGGGRRRWPSSPTGPCCACPTGRRSRWPRGPTSA
jgi:hypothetical protein